MLANCPTYYFRSQTTAMRTVGCYCLLDRLHMNLDRLLFRGNLHGLVPLLVRGRLQQFYILPKNLCKTFINKNYILDYILPTRQRLSRTSTDCSKLTFQHAHFTAFLTGSKAYKSWFEQKFTQTLKSTKRVGGSGVICRSVPIGILLCSLFGFSTSRSPAFLLLPYLIRITVLENCIHCFLYIIVVIVQCYLCLTCCASRCLHHLKKKCLTQNNKNANEC